MTLRGRKGYAAIIGLVLLIGTLLGCSIVSSNSTPVVDGEIDISRYVKLSMCLIGPSSTESIMAYHDTVEELNNSLKEKINANVEIIFIPFGEVDTQYPAIFNSKESFDIIYTSISGKPSYFGLVAQETFKPLDELLPIYAEDIWKETYPERWEDTKYEGKIYGIPFGEVEYRTNGYIFREDLLKKYEIEPILSMEAMENYMNTLLEEEVDITPVGLNQEDAIKLYDMLVDLNTTWIPAPGLAQSSLYLVSRSKDDISDILHPAFSSDFMEFAEKMKEWADKGFWAKDVLTVDRDVMGDRNSKENASLFGDAKRYINGSKEFPINFFCFGEENQKVIKGSAAKNALGISSKSDNAERALMLLDFIMKDKDTHKLLNYGIKGQITGYAEATDMVDHYESISIKDPYSKFAFESASIEDEIENILRVNSQYGIPILLGKAGDSRAAVYEYRQELKAAGIQKVIDTLREQLKDF